MNNVIDFLKKHHITFEVVDGNITIPGPLDLNSLTSIPEGFNPTVGGSLYLNSVTGKKPTEILEETKDAFGGSQFRSVVGAS